MAVQPFARPAVGEWPAVDGAAGPQRGAGLPAGERAQSTQRSAATTLRNLVGRTPQLFQKAPGLIIQEIGGVFTCFLAAAMSGHCRHRLGLPTSTRWK